MVKKNKDTRKIAIYARKSKVSNKGDSILAQIEKCKEYVKQNKNKFDDIDDNYEFEIYQDYGMTGYNIARPDFNRLLKDVEAGKISTVLCYKLDRISRKTSDFAKLLEFMEKHKVELYLCSNNISSDNKMMAYFLSFIAEFERDLIKERIEDNLMQLAEDGRWLGGRTPLGFTSVKYTRGEGKGKTIVSFLDIDKKEKKLVEEIFDLFLIKRSYNLVIEELNKTNKKTREGKSFKVLAIKDIIKNPHYCVADKNAYNYFYNKNSKMCGLETEYNGKNGLSVYNRTKQTKVEADESTILNPVVLQHTELRDEEEWIIAVGKHEGIIPSEKWIEAQKIRKEIADKYNRPHESSNALLSGLIFCPKCHVRLNVQKESNRYTNGKPSFRYICPNATKAKGKVCDYQAVRGVQIDEVVIDRLSKLDDEEKSNYSKLFTTKIDRLINNDNVMSEIKDLKKQISSIEKDIDSQTKNLRDAPNERVKKIIFNDIDELTLTLEEVNKKYRDSLQALEDDKSKIKDYKEVLDTLTSFSATSDYNDMLTLIRKVIERVYFISDGENMALHIIVKGCTTEDYDEFFGDSEGASSLCNREMNSKLHSYICRSAIKKRV